MLDLEAIKERLQLYCERAMRATGPIHNEEVVKDFFHHAPDDIDALIAEVERLRSPAVLLLYGEPFESHPCEIMADPPGSLIVRCQAMEEAMTVAPAVEMERDTYKAECERLRAEVALRTDERNALAAQVEVYTRGVTVRLVEGNE